MKVSNLSKRLICIQTADGRVDIIPGVVTDDKRLDTVKGEKIFKHYLDEGILKEVAKQTEKEILIEKAESLGIDTTDLTIAQLKEEIEAEEL